DIAGSAAAFAGVADSLVVEPSAGAGSPAARSDVAGAFSRAGIPGLSPSDILTAKLWPTANSMFTVGATAKPSLVAVNRDVPGLTLDTHNDASAPLVTERSVP